MINVDFEGLVPHSLLALLGDEFVQTVLDDIATSARAKWIRLAQQRLDSSKRDYINGIQEIEGSGFTRTISLVGWLPNAVENGISAFDLRTTLLGQGKGKESKDGHRYRAIPFRHATPGGAGSAGTPMGARYGPQGGSSLAWAASGLMSKGQASELGKSIYGQAKRLKQGQRLGAGTGRTTVPKGRSMIQVPKLAPWHKTDIFSGMQREQKTYKAATQSQYTTFRTISEKEPTGWIHPGIQGRGLLQEVEEHIQSIASKAVLAAVNSALKGMAS